MRIAALSAMLVLALAAPAAADETIVAPTFFNADGGSVASPALVAGAQYRLEVGGTFQEVGPNVTFDHDAAYCYGDTSSAPICRDDPYASNTGLWAGYLGSAAAPFYQLESSTPPAYASSHRYTTRFTAAQSAPLRFSVNTPELDRSYPGQIGVALYKVSAPCGSRRAGCTNPSVLTTPPKPGEQVQYPRPAPDQTEVAVGPLISKAVKSASVDIDTFSLDVYSVWPDDGSALSAAHVCGLFAYGSDWSGAIGAAAAKTFINCVVAVSTVLTRCKQLKTARGGPGICGGQLTRASAGCPARVTRGRAPYKLACTPRLGGVRLTVKPRKKGMSLRKAIGRHPRLVLGASYVETSSTTIPVTWRVKR